MKVRIELTSNDLKELVINCLRDQLSGRSFDPELVKVEVKSTQNFKSEWEPAAFRAVYEEL